MLANLVLYSRVLKLTERGCVVCLVDGRDGGAGEPVGDLLHPLTHRESTYAAGPPATQWNSKRFIGNVVLVISIPNLVFFHVRSGIAAQKVVISFFNFRLLSFHLMSIRFQM